LAFHDLSPLPSLRPSLALALALLVVLLLPTAAALLLLLLAFSASFPAKASEVA
jgi:hypothetical protein